MLSRIADPDLGPPAGPHAVPRRITRLGRHHHHLDRRWWVALRLRGAHLAERSAARVPLRRGAQPVPSTPHERRIPGDRDARGRHPDGGVRPGEGHRSSRPERVPAHLRVNNCAGQPDSPADQSEGSLRRDPNKKPRMTRGFLFI